MTTCVQPVCDAKPATAQSLQIRVVCGRDWLGAEQINCLSQHVMIELPAEADDLVELWMAGRLVARGRLVDVEDRVAVEVVEVLDQPAAEGERC